jgi:hypothetical protein
MKKELPSVGYLGLNNHSFVAPSGFPILAGNTFTTYNRGEQMFMVGAS